MGRHNEHHERTKGVRAAGKAPSAIDRVNPDEISIKITNLVERLRGPENKVINWAVMERVNREQTMSQKGIAFRGGRRCTLDEATCIGRREAEAAFLGGYLPGLIQIFDKYFQRLEIKLSSSELEEVWNELITPYFNGMVQTLIDDFKADRKEVPRWFVETQIDALQKQAISILNRGSNVWREKVEEAVSVERFGRPKPGVAPVAKPNTEDVGVQPLDIPPRTTWEDLHITMGELTLHVEANGKTEDRNFQEVGFEEKRRGKVPDRLWTLLRVLGMSGGMLPFDDPKLKNKERQNLKQYVSQLRKRFKALFPIQGDPFQPVGKGRQYRSRFKISSEEGPQFPTPGDTTWDKVAIEELASGLIRFSVETFQPFPAFSEDADGVSRPEAALRQSCLKYDYDLCSLGLARADGSPDRRGSALLDLLRRDGKATRHSKDEAMFSLGKFLCEFMPIDEPAFQFYPQKRLWSANFAASSTSAAVPGNL